MPGVTYEEALAALEGRLSRGGMQHSIAVADEAARIAGVYDVDPDIARVAGLLHDWSRDITGPDLRASAQAHGIPITSVDEAVPYLLHAHVGAAELSEAFPELDIGVVNAVARHTLGSSDMTPLDMVVYLADMIEPGRSFEDVERLRGLVGEIALQDLYAEAYAVSIRHLVASRKRLHPETARTWNSIVDRISR